MCLHQVFKVWEVSEGATQGVYQGICTAHKQQLGGCLACAVRYMDTLSLR